MLDRESSFKDQDVVRLLTDDFIPVALDVWYEERRQDEAGELYRKIVYQRKGVHPGRTSQGLYIFEPNGDLVLGWNNRNPERLVSFLKKHRKRSDPIPNELSPETATNATDEGTVVVNVFTRILEANWPKTDDRWKLIMQESTGRDHLWVLKDEIQELAQGRFPPTLARRVARFHCTDDTRGEPPMWSSDEVERAEMTLTNGTLAGRVTLATKDGSRGFDAGVVGSVAVTNGQLTRFDLTIRGAFHGEGRWTNGAPPGSFTLAIVTEIGPAKAAHLLVPPQAARSRDEYRRAR